MLDTERGSVRSTPKTEPVQEADLLQALAVFPSLWPFQDVKVTLPVGLCLLLRKSTWEKQQRGENQKQVETMAEQTRIKLEAELLIVLFSHGIAIAANPSKERTAHRIDQPEGKD